MPPFLTFSVSLVWAGCSAGMPLTRNLYCIELHKWHENTRIREDKNTGRREGFLKNAFSGEYAPNHAGWTEQEKEGLLFIIYIIIYIINNKNLPLHSSCIPVFLYSRLPVFLYSRIFSAFCYACAHARCFKKTVSNRAEPWPVSNRAEPWLDYAVSCSRSRPHRLAARVLSSPRRRPLRLTAYVVAEPMVKRR